MPLFMRWRGNKKGAPAERVKQKSSEKIGKDPFFSAGLTIAAEPAR